MGNEEKWKFYSEFDSYMGIPHNRFACGDMLVTQSLIFFFKGYESFEFVVVYLRIRKSPKKKRNSTADNFYYEKWELYNQEMDHTMIELILNRMVLYMTPSLITYYIQAPMIFCIYNFRYTKINREISYQSDFCCLDR